MSSNKFLQRFEGKIQIVGKTGIQGLFAGRNDNVTVYTNNNFYQQQKNKTATSLGKPRPKESFVQADKTVQDPVQQEEKQQEERVYVGGEGGSEKVLHLPAICNPHEGGKRRTEEQPTLAEGSSDKKKKTNYSSRSLEKRRDSDWGKLGGLGANLGGEQWLLKKKKLEKMQAFAEQVKMSKKIPKMPKQERRYQYGEGEGGLGG